ncbi:MAG: ATP-binding cassette domain-containing protein, partial [Rhodococcus sp. (in: high G+C Gram-positive bacteria)]
TYPDGTEAVRQLDLDVRRGELVCLVGPSGCGKSTTLKMINRMIEPSSGTIEIDGQDVTTQDPVQLRRGIGYVIQQVGLFPHQKVVTNVMTVPLLYGESKATAKARALELLDLVGLDPATYADRYPHQLSGGQQQRVGVARALAANPPVLLMDEPFGAVDPITRVRLQDSLIAIQHELAKTIVIVTHDFEEATKLGDKVLILSEGGHIEQYATPEEILAKPASPFVEEFIGSGATLAHLTLSRVKDVDHDSVVTAEVGDASQEVIARARAQGATWIVVIDEHGRPRAWPSLDEVATKERITDYVDERLPTVAPSSTLNDALDTMLAASQGGVLVTDGRGAVTGALTIATVMAVIRGQLSDARSGDGHVSYSAHTEGAAT